MARPTKQQPQDMPAILAEIRDGKTHREIAKRLKISHSTLCDWLAKPDVSDLSARAMLDSAEAWLDRGLEAVELTPDANRGRYIAQECARRAGLRNRYYRERMAIDSNHTGTIDVRAVTELSNNDLLAIAGGGRTIEQASGGRESVSVHAISTSDLQRTICDKLKAVGGTIGGISAVTKSYNGFQ